MSEHSELSPMSENRRLNEDTISSLPRKSFQVTMTGGIIHQESCTTLMTDSNSENESLIGEEKTKSAEKTPLAIDTEIGHKEEETQYQFPKVWKHMDEEGAVLEQEDPNPLNSPAYSTKESTDMEEEVASEFTKDSEEKEVQRYCTKKYQCMLVYAVVISLVILAITIPTVVIAVSKEEIATMAPSQSMSPSLSPSLSFRPSDLPSMVPTDSFVPSYIPSNLPSHVPSNSPTDTYKPSESPSSIPSVSLVPSVVPTESMVPSSEPSVAPTDTQSPSHEPTKLPSSVPSESFEPTWTPIDPKWRFKLRLYWEEGYYWQEEKDERFWCLECVKCEEYGRDDGWKHGCVAYENGLNINCQDGDSVWIRDCRKYGNEYNVLQRPEHGYTLRLHNTNLCIDRRNKHLRMKECNIEDPDQQFVAWSDFSKFELRPLVMEDWTEREADCVSQLHHPKSDEVVGMHNCRLSRHYETRYWEIYK